ncbi:hypothetical protein UFOVP567_12 [uncultured Caudovirales phage]|uniref:Uncharacterized protein n=1 Tax=uncultured Caudovirales phage TaxID=2100421 RepID=A0A6J5MWG8_9CAUD|nr:hypothetical protein UFOVP567_12 [uncultured Caudovirales phage]
MTSTSPPFSSSVEAVAASSADLFRLVEVVNTHDNWAFLFERCESVHRYSDDSRIFVGLGWCVRLLPRGKTLLELYRAGQL